MKIIVIPDVQAKHGDDFSFLSWIGKHCAEEKPDVIVQIGDFADMESLCEYDKGKKSFEGRSYKRDIEAAKDAMSVLMAPILKKQLKLETNHRKRWNPRLVLTLGNHCNRINRAIDVDRKLEGLISVNDLGYESFGWEVIPFLRVIVIGGVLFVHYYCTGEMGRAASSAKLLLQHSHMSTIVGHKQGKDICYSKRGDGKKITCIIAGSCYNTPMQYLNDQTNNHWKGIVQLDDVCDGEFNERFLSLDQLKNIYEH